MSIGKLARFTLEGTVLFFHRSVLSSVDEDTIVFVFGDHGMTSTGDHGGETELETNAALLVYSPRAIFNPHQVGKHAH